MSLDASSAGLRLPHPARPRRTDRPALAAGARRLLEWVMEVLPIPRRGRTRVRQPRHPRRPVRPRALPEHLARDRGGAAVPRRAARVHEARLAPAAHHRLAGALLRLDPPEHPQARADRDPKRAAGRTRPSTRSVVLAIRAHHLQRSRPCSADAEADPDAANEWLAVNVLQADWFVHAPWLRSRLARARPSLGRLTRSGAERLGRARSRPRGRPGDRAARAPLRSVIPTCPSAEPELSRT